MSSEDEEEAIDAARDARYRANIDHYNLGRNDIFVDEEGDYRQVAVGNGIVDNPRAYIDQNYTQRINWALFLTNGEVWNDILYRDHHGVYTNQDGILVGNVRNHILLHYTAFIVHEEAFHENGDLADNEDWVSANRRRRRAIRRAVHPSATSDSNGTQSSSISNLNSSSDSNQNQSSSSSISNSTTDSNQTQSSSGSPTLSTVSEETLPLPSPPRKQNGRGERGRGGRGTGGRGTGGRGTGGRGTGGRGTGGNKGRGQHPPVGPAPPGGGRGGGIPRGRGRGRGGPRDLNIQPPPFRRGDPRWGDRAYRPGR